MASRHKELPPTPREPVGTETALRRAAGRYCRQAFEALWGPWGDDDAARLDFAAHAAWWRDVRRSEDDARRIARRLREACEAALRFEAPEAPGPSAIGLGLALPCLRGALRRLEPGTDRAPFPGEPTLGGWLRWNRIENRYGGPLERRLTDREVTVLALLAGYWPPSGRRASGKSVARLLGETDRNVHAARQVTPQNPAKRRRNRKRKVRG